jgi:hypothetical protein
VVGVFQVADLVLGRCVQTPTLLLAAFRIVHHDDILAGDGEDTRPVGCLFRGDDATAAASEDQVGALRIPRHYIS